MATPSANNPGYYEVTTWDPATKGSVVTTYRDDGAVAYRQSVAADGTRTLIGSVGNEVDVSSGGQGGAIATPDGTGFKRRDGTILSAAEATPQATTAGGFNVSNLDWTQARNDARSTLESAKTASEKLNLVNLATGQQAPGFDNSAINKTIDKTLGGDGTGFGSTSQPAGSTPPAGGAGSASLTGLSTFDPYKPAATRTSPVINAPAPVTPGASVTPTTVTAPTVSAPAPSSAPPSIDFDTGLVAAGQISSAPSAGPAPQVSAPQLGPGQQIGAGSVTAGSIRGSTPLINPNQTAAPVADVAAGGAGRDAQLNALGQLNDIATGKTKTAADWLLQKGIDENVGAAYGLAASLQGRNPGVALRTGAITAKDAIAKSAADVAAQKAQEQQKAASDYAALGTSIAGQDLQALMSNQSKDLQLSVTNLNAKIEVLKSNQQTQLEEGKADLAAQTAAQIATLQAQTTTAVANLQSSTARDIANQTAQLDASKANAANAVALQITDANNQMAALKANLEAQTAANNTNAMTTTQKQIAVLDSQTKLLQQQQDQLYDAAKTNANNALSASQTNSNNSTQAQIAAAKNALDAQLANAANELAAATASGNLAEKTQADADAQDARLKQLGLEQLTAQLNAAMSAAKTQQERDAADQAFEAGLIKIGATLLAA